MSEPWYPDVVATDERLSALADLSARLEALPVELALTHLVDVADERLLPHLAYGWHVTSLEGWQLADTPEKRRALLRRAIALHRKKGTPWAVKEAIAMSGLGDGSRLIEGRAMRRYDGTLYADGSDIYGGHRWAEYQLEADLGETSGLDASIAAAVAEAAAEWAPVSRHLTRLAWRADVSDRIEPREAPATAGQLTASSQRPWRRLYDGTQRYDQGVLLAYDGATQANGSRLYQGWAVNDGHWRAGAPESDTTLAIEWADADRQQATLCYDGATLADGTSDYGAHAPVAKDAARLDWHAEDVDRIEPRETPTTAGQLTASSQRPWRRLYDGAQRYDQGVLLAYDGATRANGTRMYRGWAVNDGHWRVGSPESDTTLALSWADADRQQAALCYDGATQADGTSDYGAHAPVATDVVMSMTARRHVRYDGRYTAGSDNCYDGAWHYDGQRQYRAGRIASGDEIFYLEAA